MRILYRENRKTQKLMLNQISQSSNHLDGSTAQTQVTSNIDSLLAFIAIAFMALVAYAGTIPYRVSAFTRSKFLKEIGNTFAGAVFFNVAMLHILPQANQAMLGYFNPQGTKRQTFPLAFLLMIVGFLVTILLTKVLAGASHQQVHEQRQQIVREVQMRVIQASSMSDKLIQNQEDSEKGSKQNLKVVNHREILLLTATIYLHTLFEGISIGVQNTHASLISTALAIGLHKWADAFSIGMFYKNKGLGFMKAYLLVGLQAMMNGVAIGVGKFIQSKGKFLQAIFLSISAGIFLGLSIMHILNQQFGKKRYIWHKFGVMVLATLLVLCIWVVEAGFGNGVE